MNALETYIYEAGLNETSVMNALQDEAVISDNCVWAADVANGDCITAVKWLLEHLS